MDSKNIKSKKNNNNNNENLEVNNDQLGENAYAEFKNEEENTDALSNNSNNNNVRME